MPLLLLLLLILAGLGFANIAYDTGSGWGRALPIALGATLAATISVANQWLLERRRRRDAREILYQELLFLTFRCAWDFGDPWRRFWTSDDGNFTPDRVQKFRPDKTTVFDSLGRELALIPPRALARVLRFHQCLELWRGSLDHYLYHQPEKLADEGVRRHLVKRLGDSLQLGWSALAMLRVHVGNASRIEREFRASLEPTHRVEVARSDFIAKSADEAAALVKKPLF